MLNCISVNNSFKKQETAGKTIQADLYCSNLQKYRGNRKDGKQNEVTGHIQCDVSAGLGWRYLVASSAKLG